MNNLITELATARADLDELKEKAAKMMADFKNSPEYSELTKQIEQVDARVFALDDQIRFDAFMAYKHGGNKNPHEAVVVKIFKTVEIKNTEQAREWCIKNFTPALKLDEKTFKDAAKKGTVPAQFVEIEDVPRAQIASDLSEYVQK